MHAVPAAAREAVGRAWEGAVGASVARSLRSAGYAVVDGAFPGVADSLREELLDLRASGGLSAPNETRFVSKALGEVRLAKARVLEQEAQDVPEGMAPHLRAMQFDGSLCTLLNVMLATPPGRELRGQAVKAQLNEGGGGCFPLHFDSDVALDGRRVTALNYLNPAWAPGDGGELVLYPLSGGGPVTLEPIHGRLVLFSAPLMLHRVLPSSAGERLCVTTWAYGRRAGPGREGPRPAVAPGAGPEALALPELRKHLLRLAWAKEWADSIRDSHPSGEARDAHVAAHWDEVDVIERALTAVCPSLDRSVRLLREGKPAEAFDGAHVDWLL